MKLEQLLKELSKARYNEKNDVFETAIDEMLVEGESADYDIIFLIAMRLVLLERMTFYRDLKGVIRNYILSGTKYDFEKLIITSTFVSTTEFNMTALKQEINKVAVDIFTLLNQPK